MVLKAQVRTCELRGHEKKKKKDFPNPLESKSQIRTCGVNFGNIIIFVFMVLKAQVWTCELRGHEKKKKKISPTPSTSKSQFRKCGVNFEKIQNFVYMVVKAQVCLYGPKGTGPDL